MRSLGTMAAADADEKSARDPALWLRNDMRRSRPLLAGSQSEVSDILRKKRRITSYEVLVRIAEGLSLTYDQDTEKLLGENATPEQGLSKRPRPATGDEAVRAKRT